MKRSRKVAVRYARALLNALVSEKQASGNGRIFEETAQSLERVASTWKNSRDFQFSLISPQTTREHRLQLFKRILEQLAVNAQANRFLVTVFNHDRLTAIPEMAVVFRELADRAQGVVKVTITSARKLPAQLETRVEQTLAERLGGIVRFRWERDESLIGGVVVEYDGKLLDGSVKNKLDQLRHSIAA